MFGSNKVAKKKKATGHVTGHHKNIKTGATMKKGGKAGATPKKAKTAKK